MMTPSAALAPRLECATISRDAARRADEPIDTVSSLATTLLPHVASAVSLRFGFHMVAAARRRSTPIREEER